MLNPRERFDKRKFIFSHPRIIGALLKIHNVFGLKKKGDGKDNIFDAKRSLLKRVTLEIYGNKNHVLVSQYSRLKNVHIFINGSNNNIYIGERCYLNDTDIYIEDDGNSLTISYHTSIDGPVQLAMIEGTKIYIGDDCMFSGEIQVKTGDSHSILDNNGTRINASKNVVIGKHCWIGTRVLILKGTEISNNTIIGAGSIVTSKFATEGIIIAGNPARCVREGVSWKRERQ